MKANSARAPHFSSYFRSPTRDNAIPKPFALIVEDDNKLNKIIFITLQADFEIETCTDASAALERLKNIAPEIVVLDLNLPGPSDADIPAHIRSDERLARRHVIPATADERQAETLTDNADIVLLNRSARHK